MRSNLSFGSFSRPRFRFSSVLVSSLVAVGLVTASASFRPAHAQLEDDPMAESGPQTEATLIAESKDIRPGQPFTLALRLKLEKDWHVYWRNPGDSGTATRIEWALPKGFSAGAIQWPVPHRFVTPPMVAYGYENEVWLLTQITPPVNLTPGQAVTLGADASWLICSEQCVPQKRTLAVRLNVIKDAPTPDETYKAQFAAARASLPLPIAQTGITVRATQTAVANAKPPKTNLNLFFSPGQKTSLTAEQLNKLYFYPADESTLTHPANQKFVKEGTGYRLPLAPSEYASGPLKRVRGVLMAPPTGANVSGPLTRGVWVDVPVLAVTPINKKAK